MKQAFAIMFSIVLTLLFSTVSRCDEQNTSSAPETWQRILGGEETEHFHSIISTNDGGYVAVGETMSVGNGLNDVWLVKLDAHGNKVFERTLGSLDHEYATKIIPTSNGGYYILTIFQTKCRCEKYAKLYRLSEKFTKLWEEQFTVKTRQPRDIAAGPGNTLYVTGTDNAMPKTSDTSAWFVQYDEEGDNFPRKYISAKDHSVQTPIFATVLENGSAVIISEYLHSSIMSKLFDVVAPDGQILSRKIHDHPAIKCESHAVKILSDGGYILVGTTGKKRNYYDDDQYACAIRFNSAGDIEWAKNYVANHGGAFDDVAELSDGTIAFAGGTLINDDKEQQIWLVRTDTAGNILNVKTYGHDKRRYYRNDVMANADSIIATPDGGIVIAGALKNNFDDKKTDAVIMKLDKNFEFVK